MLTQKQNVEKFNGDVIENDGYRYTSIAPFSSIVANNRITKATLDFIPSQSKTIVDIGCGDGLFTSQLKKELPDKFFFGFDPAATAIAIAEKKYKEIDFFVGDLLNEKTFPNQKFDLGIIRGVLHHLPNGFNGILNAGILSDELIIIEPNGNNFILKMIEKKSAYHIQHEEQSFSSKLLVEWCNKANMKIIKIDYIGFVPFFFPTFLAKIIYFFQPVLEKIYPLKKYFGAQIIIHCKKNNNG